MKDQTFLITRSPTVIGRVEGDIRLPDPKVSARHAQVELAGGDAWLRDLGATRLLYSYIEDFVSAYEALTPEGRRAGRADMFTQRSRLSRAGRKGGAVVAGWLLASLLAGCLVVDKRGGGPPPWAPAHGRRAQGVVVVPPPVTVQPSLVLIAGTPVAFVENWSDDLFFYDGRYYRPYQGGWYWSVAVGGPWTYVSVGQVPSVVLHVPPDYRARKGGPWAPAHGARGKGKGKKWD